ncbi:MAG: hypothetical protein WCC53_08005 [Thermoanaerobaculia bacterium]
MSPAFEAYLARIYTDEGERALFLADSRGRAAAAGLAPAEVDALAEIDRDGLALAAQSFARKRAQSHAPDGFAARLRRLARSRP